MAVKFGKAFGLIVTVLSTSESKKREALNILGADKFVVSSDRQQMEVMFSENHCGQEYFEHICIHSGVQC